MWLTMTCFERNTFRMFSHRIFLKAAYLLGLISTLYPDCKTNKLKKDLCVSEWFVSPRTHESPLAEPDEQSEQPKKRKK